MRKPSYKTLEKRVVFDNSKFGYVLRSDRVIRPSGDEGTFMVLDGPSHALVVAVTKELEVVLVEQYRYPIAQWSWEVVGETADPGEDLLTTAKRGLLEEANVTAKKWIETGSHQLALGVADLPGKMYLALEADVSKMRPEDKKRVKLVSLEKAMEMVRTSEIVSPESKCAILLAWEYLQIKR